MKTELFVVCDAGTLRGGMSLVGIFDTLRAKTLPLKVRSFTIALIITFGLEDEGLHKIKVDMVDEDGALVHVFNEDKINVVLPVMKSRFIMRTLHVRTNHSFKKYGAHQIRLFLDDNFLADTAIDVKPD